MSEEMLIQIVEQMFFTAAILVLPVFAVTLLIGIVVSIFQAVTNIQEQSLVFIAKMFGTMLLLFFALPWMFQILVSLTFTFFEYILVITQG